MNRPLNPMDIKNCYLYKKAKVPEGKFEWWKDKLRPYTKTDEFIDCWILRFFKDTRFD